MERNTGSLSWLHGLEDFFRFKEENEIADHCANFLKIQYSENKAPTLRNAVVDSLPDYASKDLVFNLMNFYSHTSNAEDNMKLKEITSALALMFPNNPLFFSIKKFYRETNLDLSDAFSRGQVQSKIWLATELAKISNRFSDIVVLAGWYGQLVKYLSNLDYDRIRVVDIDRTACLVSDSIMNVDAIENYKVKAVCDDINKLACTQRGYEFQIENFKNIEQKVYTEQISPTLIINTSAEHMNEDWYNTIRFKKMITDPIVAIQSNNLFDIEEHVNCVHSIDHMKKKYPMSIVLFEGELQLQGYKRVMLIGKP